MTIKKKLNGATLLVSDVLPTAPGPRDFVGHYFGAKGAKDEADEYVRGQHLDWEEIVEGDSGFHHYDQRGLRPARIYWASFHPVVSTDKIRYFVVLEF